MSSNYSFYRVFAAACLAMLTFGIVLISLGSILPDLMVRFQLNELGAGALASLLPAGILVGSLLFGPIVDRYSYRNLLVVSTLLVVLSLEGIAFSRQFYLVQVFIFLIGISGGALNGGANALVADISRAGAKSRGANLSFLGVFFGIGALGMPSLLGLLTSRLAFDTVLSLIGGLLLLPVVFFLLIHYPRAKHSEGVPLKEGVLLLREADLVLLGFVLFFQSGAEGLVNNWTTTYLQRQVGVEPAKALYALSLFVLSLTLARLLLSGLLKRIRPYALLTGSMVLAFAGNGLLLTGAHPGISLAGLILLGAGLAAGFPVILGYVGDLFARLSGTAFSLVLVIALIGNMLLNYLMGIIARLFGFGQLPALLLGCLACLTLLLVTALVRIRGKTAI